MSMIEIYQSPSQHEDGASLFEEELLPRLLIVCRTLQKKNSDKEYSVEKISEQFTKLQEAISLEKEVVIECNQKFQLDWHGLLLDLVDKYPQFIWTKVSCENTTGSRSYYTYNFVPIAYREFDFPFVINLVESLYQQNNESKNDEISIFHEELSDLVKIYSCEQKIENKLEQENPLIQDQIVLPQMENETYNINDFRKYKEELVKEKNAKERMKLANQKLEALMTQMERKIINSAVGYLENPRESFIGSDWHKIEKIDLRDYSQLIQKASYLEKIFLMNQSLETKNEKMVISDSELVYEREQVKDIKSQLNLEEIFWGLEECEMIDKRVKIRRGLINRKPIVRLMKMDYESLLEKSAYFDLLQGENYLLEKRMNQEVVNSEENTQSISQ